MFLRNGIKSNLRAKGRTALFVCLILLLTFAVVLALGVRLYCGSAMAACEQVYRSVAKVEYMGADYPDANVADDFGRAAAAAIDDRALAAVEGVKAWCRDGRSLCHPDGYTRRGNDMPYRDRAVVMVWNVSPVYATTQVLKDWVLDNSAYAASLQSDPGGAGVSFELDDPLLYDVVTTDRVAYYTATLTRSLYSYENKEHVIVNLLPGATGFAPEPDVSYVVHGSFVDTQVGGPANGMRTLALCRFDHADDLPWAACPGDGTPPAVFTEQAARYNIINNYVETVTAPDLEDVWPFHQGLLALEQGRFPAPDETDACVISGDVASVMDKTVGDTIAVASCEPAADDRYDLTLTDRRETLRIVGVTNGSTDYRGCLWRVGNAPAGPLFGYVIGTASLENRRAADAAEAIQRLMPDNVRVTLFDQGYADAVEPFETLQSTASNVLLASATGVIAVLVLFAFLFVGRQNQTVRILVSLGTPRRGIRAWLLSGAVLIAGASALTGGLLGTLALPLCFSLIQALAAAMRDTRLRFSEMLVGRVLQPELAVSVSPLPIAAVILGVLLLAAAFCLIFLHTAARGGTLRRGKSRVRVPKGKTSLAGRGSGRFALLSVRRGGARSLIVPGVSAVLCVTVLFLGGVYQGWQNDLQTARQTARVEGQITSADGQYYADLVVSLNTVRQLRKLDDVTDLAVSADQPYWLPQEMPAFGHSSFGEEHRQEWIARQPRVVAVNRLRGAKEFYYTEPSVTWLEGWDEGFLSRPLETDDTGRLSAVPAVVSDRFLAVHELQPGDGFSVVSPLLPYTRIRVVGVYKQTGNRAHIYVPLAAFIDPDIVLDDAEIPRPSGNQWTWTAEDHANYRLLSTTFSTCRFTLTSAERLDQTRRILADAGFGWPGHLGSNRVTVLLRDASFVKITESLGRYLTMGRVMMGLILLVVALLGFIISWLMVDGRKPEFALMRGLGVKKKRVFFSFFLEQAGLCLTGCLAGCLIAGLTLPGAADGWLPWLAAAGYLLFYLAGCALSVRLIGKTDLMALLTVKE